MALMKVVFPEPVDPATITLAQSHIAFSITFKCADFKRPSSCYRESVNISGGRTRIAANGPVDIGANIP